MIGTLQFSWLSSLTFSVHFTLYQRNICLPSLTFINSHTECTDNSIFIAHFFVCHYFSHFIQHIKCCVLALLATIYGNKPAKLYDGFSLLFQCCESINLCKHGPFSDASIFDKFMHILLPCWNCCWTCCCLVISPMLFANGRASFYTGENIITNSFRKCLFVGLNCTYCVVYNVYLLNLFSKKKFHFD